MLMFTETITATASGGAISQNTSCKLKGEVRKVSIQPTTSTTQYDFSLTDGNSIKFYDRQSLVGTATNFEPFNVNSYLTVAIDNATVDEEFIIEFEVRII